MVEPEQKIPMVVGSNPGSRGFRHDTQDNDIQHNDTQSTPALSACANEERLQHACTFCLCVHATLNPSLSLSLTGEQGAPAHPLHRSERERERKRGGERKSERE